MATAYEKVQLARGKGRPSGLSFIQNIFPDFIELHGDRRFADDPAVIGGIATLGGRAVTVIAIEKGADTKDKVYRNFGSPNPEGYRKALRLMKQAEKFHRPVICFVDTSGAFCGIGAEERGQGQAIAENLVEMIGLKTANIDLNAGTMIGGVKTAAGKNRLVPIHSKIQSIVQRRFEQSKGGYLFEYNGKKLNESQYRDVWNELMNTLNMDHTPHECRHTFRSRLDSAGANKVCICLLYTSPSPRDRG